MKRNKTFLILPCLLLLLFSCYENDVVKKKDFEVIDGRLAFSNMNALNSFMKEAHSKSIDEFMLDIKKFEADGFKSLLPTFDPSHEQQLAEYRDRKVLRFQRYNPSLSPQAKILLQDDPDDEDHLIADPYYAATLNVNREIQVEGNIYNYNETGLYTTTFSGASKLSPFLENSEVAFLKTIPVGTEYEVDAGVTVSKLTIANAIDNDGIGSMGAAISSTADPYDPNNYRLCSQVRDNIWADIFGPSSVCTDYFESDKRVKTKVWNQNYLLYSSIGISVRSQNRFLRIWWRDKIDELRLGYNYATFKYPSVNITLPNFQYTFYYEYNGVIVDQMGNFIRDPYSPKVLFTEFPIKDEDKSIIKIYYYDPFKQQKDFFELTGQQVNEFVSDQLQAGVKSLVKFGEKELETKSVMLSKFDPSDVYFVYGNWKDMETNTGAIIEVFDWNTSEIKFTTNPGGSGGVSWAPKYNAKSYSKFKIEMYGIGKRGSKYRGSRIEFED